MNCHARFFAFYKPLNYWYSVFYAIFQNPEIRFVKIRH